MNLKLHLFDKQCDKGKVPTLEKSTDAHEKEVTNDVIFMSTDPIQAIRKLKFKAKRKLIL